MMEWRRNLSAAGSLSKANGRAYSIEMQRSIGLQLLGDDNVF